MIFSRDIQPSKCFEQDATEYKSSDVRDRPKQHTPHPFTHLVQWHQLCSEEEKKETCKPNLKQTDVCSLLDQV